MKLCREECAVKWVEWRCLKFDLLRWTDETILDWCDKRRHTCFLSDFYFTVALEKKIFVMPGSEWNIK